MKDFFISYNKVDRGWGEWIAWQLEESGYSVFLQAWDFRPGSNFVLDMQESIANSERIIAVLSPEYLSSCFTKPEWASAFAKDPTGENGLLLPVKVRNCDPVGLIPQIIYIDLRNVVDEVSANSILLDGIKRGRAKPLHPPLFPSSRTIIKKPLLPIGEILYFSSDERNLLIDVATESSGTGIVRLRISKSSVSVDIFNGDNYENFVEKDSLEEVEHWKLVINKLVSLNLLEQRDQSGEIYAITEAGYHAVFTIPNFK